MSLLDRTKESNVKLLGRFNQLGKGLARAHKKIPSLAAARAAVDQKVLPAMTANIPVGQTASGANTGLANYILPQPGALQRTGRTTRNIANYVASVPKGQTFTGKNTGLREAVLGQPPLPVRASRTVKNIGRAMVTPRYPGLDRPVPRTAVSPVPSVSFPYVTPPNRAATAMVPKRKFDRTRKVTATGLRRAGFGSAALSAPAVYLGATEYIPKDIAHEMARAEDLSFWQFRKRRDQLKARIQKELPAIAAAMGRSVGRRGASSATDATALQLARSLAVPGLREYLRQARKYNPIKQNIADVARSTTPAGLLATWGLREFSSPESILDPLPQVKDTVTRNAIPITAQLASGKDPGPLTAALGRILGPEGVKNFAVSQGGGHAVDEAVMQGLYQNSLDDFFRPDSTLKKHRRIGDVLKQIESQLPTSTPITKPVDVLSSDGTFIPINYYQPRSAPKLLYDNSPMAQIVEEIKELGYEEFARRRPGAAKAIAASALGAPSLIPGR